MKVDAHFTFNSNFERKRRACETIIDRCELMLV